MRVAHFGLTAFFAQASTLRAPDGEMLLKTQSRDVQAQREGLRTLDPVALEVNSTKHHTLLQTVANMVIITVRATYTEEVALGAFFTRLFGAGNSEITWRRGRFQCEIPRLLTTVCAHCTEFSLAPARLRPLTWVVFTDRTC